MSFRRTPDNIKHMDVTCLMLM